MLADQIVKDLNQPDDASTNANDVQDVLAADEERPAKKRRQDLREEQSQAAHTESTDGTNASNQTNDENVGTQPAKATTRCEFLSSSHSARKSVETQGVCLYSRSHE